MTEKLIGLRRLPLRLRTYHTRIFLWYFWRCLL